MPNKIIPITAAIVGLGVGLLIEPAAVLASQQGSAPSGSAENVVVSRQEFEALREAFKQLAQEFEKLRGQLEQFLGRQGGAPGKPQSATSQAARTAPAGKERPQKIEAMVKMLYDGKLKGQKQKVETLDPDVKRAWDQAQGKPGVDPREAFWDFYEQEQAKKQKGESSPYRIGNP